MKRALAVLMLVGLVALVATPAVNPAFAQEGTLDKIRKTGVLTMRDGRIADERAR